MSKIHPAFSGTSMQMLHHSDHGLNFTAYVFVSRFLIFIVFELILHQKKILHALTLKAE